MTPPTPSLRQPLSLGSLPDDRRFRSPWKLESKCRACQEHGSFYAERKWIPAPLVSVMVAHNICTIPSNKEAGLMVLLNWLHESARYFVRNFTESKERSQNQQKVSGRVPSVSQTETLQKCIHMAGVFGRDWIQRGVKKNLSLIMA